MCKIDIAENPNTPKETLVKLAMDSDSRVVEAIRNRKVYSNN